MSDKKQILQNLKNEFERWEKLLGSLSEGQIVAPQLAAGWSIKDVIAHLWAWQQRSIARMNAALSGTQPDYPTWLDGLDPETDHDVPLINNWIYETNRDRPWASVYSDWRTGFLRFIDQTRQVPEKDLLEKGRYGWLPGYALAIIPQASYEHHEEHIGWLQAWLRENG